MRVAVWTKAGGDVLRTMDEKNLFLMAAGVAFFSMLSLFPGLAALIAIWSLVSDPSVVEAQLILLANFVPAEAYKLIGDQVRAVTSSSTDTMTWASVLSLLFALWSARLGVDALMRGVNAVYRESNRGGLRHILAAVVLTLSLVALGIVTLGTVIVTPIVLALFPLGPIAGVVAQVMRWLIAGVVMLIALALVYRFGPNRRGARAAWITPGAFLALLLWAGASVAFSIYLTNFGNYNQVYGSIGAVIALLMWLFISAFAVLLGASLNAALELRTRRDSTVGRPRPRGERGAYVADHYIPS
ncbi:YihY/virulence factor BrkB family protein [Roseicyclus sp. F158]|uniref:YihY/virulence factor BrkB family protein n=1 Tax=Tropicimonas omnivorans TaxID=3075590 RepID=A0ABU3DJY5_9RHOB|nr:YihY/virulence factor BrkB family protein [Roseicyclus sp. F158]MDT0684024.1 YihY/virulence factor BrkB family protein [Roseicyclus sp. F158]